MKKTKRNASLLEQRIFAKNLHSNVIFDNIQYIIQHNFRVIIVRNLRVTLLLEILM